MSEESPKKPAEKSKVQLIARMIRKIERPGGKFDYLGIVIGPGGSMLTNHSSSSIEWLKNDLGFEKHQNDNGVYKSKRAIFDRKYGKNNYEISWEE